MTEPHPGDLTLKEFLPQALARDELSDSEAEHLWDHHQKQVTVEWPSPATGGKWRLTNNGWVGYMLAAE